MLLGPSVVNSFTRKHDPGTASDQTRLKHKLSDTQRKTEPDTKQLSDVLQALTARDSISSKVNDVHPRDCTNTVSARRTLTSDSRLRH